MCSPKEKTIIDLFVFQVRTNPDNLAVVFKNKKLTYRELDSLSNQFAHYLSKNYELKKEDYIGLMLERSEYLIISILGILKAGCAYVPIDIDSPTKRKEYIKNDCNCKITIDSSFIKKFKENQHLYESTKSDIQLSSDDLAYVIYTSGTTGNPKGVMIEHHSVANLFFSLTQSFEIDET